MKSAHFFLVFLAFSNAVYPSEINKDYKDKKMRFKVEKLVRDNIPESLKNKGIESNISIINDEDFFEKLKCKLNEEVEEVLEAKTHEDLIEEFADVIEVIKAMCSAKNISMEEVEKKRVEKSNIKGAFNKKIYVSCVDIPENNPAIKYYKSKPNKYPEVCLEPFSFDINKNTKLPIVSINSLKLQECILLNELKFENLPNTANWQSNSEFHKNRNRSVYKTQDNKYIIKVWQKNFQQQKIF